MRVLRVQQETQHALHHPRRAGLPRVDARAHDNHRPRAHRYGRPRRAGVRGVGVQRRDGQERARVAVEGRGEGLGQAVPREVGGGPGPGTEEPLQLRVGVGLTVCAVEGVVREPAPEPELQRVEGLAAAALRVAAVLPLVGVAVVTRGVEYVVLPPAALRREFGGQATGLSVAAQGCRPPPPPLCDIPSGRCSFPGPWTVTRSSLRMLRRVAAFCRPLRPVLLLVSFPRSRSPVVGVLGLC